MVSDGDATIDVPHVCGCFVCESFECESLVIPCRLSEYARVECSDTTAKCVEVLDDG